MDSHAMDLSTCNQELGVRSGAIPDEHITASSAHDQTVGAQNARLKKEIDGGAWCPAEMVSKDTYEWLQVNLGGLKVVTHVETQGRFGNGQGKEYAEMYRLQYWRPGFDRFITFIDRKGDDTLAGNTNTYLSVKREVDPAIVATRIRFIPYSILPQTVCMRVEIYGCNWTEGILSYAMPQGEKRGAEINLYDKTYDGREESNSHYLYGGLGQLTDGERGPDNFRLDIRGLGKGYEWIGWRNDTGLLNPVEIIFAFDRVRNFTAVRIHCNNYFSKDVQVFATARIFFSVGGRCYQGDPIEYEHTQDTVVEMAREVRIWLHNHIGKYVKIKLTLATRWLMISEISFDSDIANGNYSKERRNCDSTELEDVLTSSGLNPVNEWPLAGTGNGSIPGVSVDANSGFPEEYIGLIVGVAAALLILLSVIITVLIFRRKWGKNAGNHSILNDYDHRISTSADDYESAIPHRPVGVNCNLFVNYKSGAEMLTTDIPIPFIHKQDALGRAGHVDVAPPLPISPNESSTSREYHYFAPQGVMLANGMMLPTGPSTVPRMKTLTVPPSIPQLKPSEALSLHYAETELFRVQNIRGASGSNIYAAPPDLISIRNTKISEFPREMLHFVEKLGEGEYGEIHLCEAENLTSTEDLRLDESGKAFAVVKVLNRQVTESVRQDFLKEVRILTRLKDPNIVKVIGACTKEEPLCVILEYMEYGDLSQFLSSCYLETDEDAAPDSTLLSYGCLLYMGTQIASGMKYLESLNVVHRDLATRNCLVGHQYTIKISDFGMSQSLYSGDYYRVQGAVVLPIRWMAWESILLGRFTSKSDVWSFAVTLWEILTLSKVSPFVEMSDEEVIENVGNFYRNEGTQIYLSPPAICPREMYDLMRECWQREEHERPNFREIHLFLQRKNLGFKPAEELVRQTTG